MKNLYAGGDYKQKAFCSQYLFFFLLKWMIKGTKSDVTLIVFHSITLGENKTKWLNEGLPLALPKFIHFQQPLVENILCVRNWACVSHPVEEEADTWPGSGSLPPVPGTGWGSSLCQIHGLHGNLLSQWQSNRLGKIHVHHSLHYKPITGEIRVDRRGTYSYIFITRQERG